ncbi:sac1, partial [Symbiodinium sp. KB8]
MSTHVYVTEGTLLVTKEGVAEGFTLQRTTEVGCESIQGSLTEPSPLGKVLETVDCHGIFGVFHLLRGAYLAVVQQVSTAAKSPGPTGSLQTVRKLRFIPLSTAVLPPAAAKDEEAYLAMLHSIVARGALHFSDTWDLTNTLQRQAALGTPGDLAVGSPAVDLATPVPPQLQVQRADPRFWWNAHVCAELVELGAAPFLSVCICGFVQMSLSQSVGGERVDLFLISRRSNRRQGTRFNVRGIDSAGNVANYVETEQMLVWKSGQASSFVQTRGSIPVVWSQAVNLRYNPKCALGANQAQSQMLFSQHMQEQFAKYGKVVAVNLIDKKGDQLSLGKAYEEHTSRLASPHLQHAWFDFHAECKRMQWGNLSKLLAQVAAPLVSHGVFKQDPAGGAVTALQTGVVRTNCMDNLDRTNVVQSLFARWAVLFAVTGASSAGGSGDVLSSPFKSFERIFKALWADHADAMSKLYSGTGALKTDFTRTGKRTAAGAMADGQNSLMRYVLANFQDGRTQDAWDLHGEGKASPLSPLRRDVTPATFGARVGLLFTALVCVGTGIAQACLGSHLAGAATPASAVASAAGPSSLWGVLAPNTLPDTWPAALAWGVGGASVGMLALVYFFTKLGASAGFGMVSTPHFVHHDMVKPPRANRTYYTSDAAPSPSEGDAK